MKAYKCDSCGSFFKPSDMIDKAYDKYRIQDVCTYDKYLALCPKCQRKLVELIDGKPEI